MTGHDFLPGCEPERYELSEPPRYRFRLDRRGFLRSAGAGLVILLVLENPADAQGGGRRGGGRSLPQDLAAWLHIAEDGRVTAYTGKTEVGQNIRTSLSQAVAEELRAPMDAVRLVMADTDVTPYDAGTFGSQSTPVMSRQLRRMAAAAREVLLELAAAGWNVPRTELRAAEGKVRHDPSGRAIEYGRLTGGRKITRTVTDAPTTPAEEWKVSGRSVPRVESRDLVTGRHRYASDVRLPGMLVGRVVRPPAFGAELVSADLRPAESMPGVSVVRDGSFLGVAAPDEVTARKAAEAIRTEWKAGGGISDEQLFAALRGDRAPLGPVAAESDLRLQATYTVAYIAHAPMEPRAAVARWEGGRLTVWTGTQRPFGVRGELARAFQIPEEQVRVIVPDTGGAFGGKHSGEAAIEAARLAKAAGKPVRLIWSREEEFTWAYFRPAGVIDVSSGVRKDGTLTGWEMVNYNSGASSIRTLYEVPNPVTRFQQAPSPLRQGSYRALAATANHFARESHMDELACGLALDPLEFRLKNLKDVRFRAVLEAAAREFGWGRKLPAGRGAGIAGGSEKGSYVATCAEVEVDRTTGRLRVDRVVCAFECGAVVNPDHLKAQVEGCLVMGLGGALFESISFRDGRIGNPRFSSYRVPRFSDLPELRVVLVDRKDLPSAGAGETPIVGIAPAIANAVFAASGVRLRSLPLAPGGTLPRG